MSLRKMKKQLVASAMAVLLSAGVGVSGLLAAAPSVLAADASKGSIMLDTASYVMAPGNRYDIGAFVRDPSGETEGTRFPHRFDCGFAAALQREFPGNGQKRGYLLDSV